MKVSVIIPTFNEEKVIRDCLESLLNQTLKDLEIIVVDDASTDNTLEVVKKYPVKFLKQKHQGSGEARNLGAKNAKGEILVFADADMTFDKKFIEELINPIKDKTAIGTFSKEEYVLNKNNIWSKCWNINKNLPTNRMHPLNYPNEQKVFRAILKEEFDKVLGFDPIGYIDDYTLSDKLQKKAVVTKGAIFYHRNPESLVEVFKQARWIGKSEFKSRKIKNQLLMKLISLVRYSLPFSISNGVYKAIKYNLAEFILFKLIFDLAVEISLIGSFFGEQPNK